MVVKINFGTSDSTTLNGYTLDFGEAYSESQGYGWVEESDLSTPVDIVPNGRERDLVDDPLTDTFVHMQYPVDNPNPTAIRTPAAWQYDLPDGQYKVTVAVGDFAFFDSSHTVNIEGTNAISDFVPSPENSLTTTATEIVTVSDGQLTIDAIGGSNTKLSFVEIVEIVDIKINFGPEDFTTIPEGYSSDSGLGYSEARGYGWVTEESLGNGEATPIDMSANTRVRGLDSDPLNDTLIHMQYPEEIDRPTAIKTSAAWEYDLPDGTYEVTVGVGDPEYTDSIHTINIEGVEAISHFTPGSGDLFATTTEVVEVTDGRLTIDAIGGENTKLNFIEISNLEL